MADLFKEIDESVLSDVVGGTGECTPYDTNGDGVTTDEELENGMMYDNELF
ncbi:MAG: hypothetical protein AB1Z98_09615 [Nannocystaceae bacterium]